MKALRVNSPVAQVTERLERYAQLGTELALVETTRNDAIAGANAAADKVAAPIVAELDSIRAEVEPWWARNSATLLTGKRKTVELGGCILGSKAGTASVTFSLGNDELAAKTLLENRWSQQYARLKPSVDKPAVKAGLAGKHGEKLRALGFGMSTPSEAFILDRVVQDGTIAGKA